MERSNVHKTCNNCYTVCALFREPKWRLEKRRKAEMVNRSLMEPNAPRYSQW
jgi:hypothetical protein